MQLMLTMFGKVLHVSIGIDSTNSDPQFVCVTGGDFQLAEEEDSARSFGFGR